jgi:hypothetical protein
MDKRESNIGSGNYFVGTSCVLVGMQVPRTNKMALKTFLDGQQNFQTVPDF